MARTTYMTYLMRKSSNTYEKLVDIKEFPDLGGAPDTIDVTTLSDGMRVGLPDIIDPGSLEFNLNYDLEDYKKLKNLEGKEETYALWFGGTETDGLVVPDGNAGKFEFKGELKVWVKGNGVSSPVDMGLSITPSTEIKEATVTA